MSADPEVNEHDTLKYHLLGPSLTKAGQDKVDQQKVLPAAKVAFFDKCSSGLFKLYGGSGFAVWTVVGKSSCMNCY